MNVAHRLKERINKTFGVDIEVPERVYRSQSMKECGHIAWEAKIVGKDSMNTVISRSTMAECLKAKRLSLEQDYFIHTSKHVDVIDL